MNDKQRTKQKATKTKTPKPLTPNKNKPKRERGSKGKKGKHKMKERKVGKYRIETWTDEQGKFNVKVFNTKKKYPLMADKWFYFSSELKRDEYIDRFIARVENWEKEKKERREVRKAFKTSLKPGDIISNSWGYDQTNVAFFKVISIPTPKRAIVQKIGSSLTENSDYGSMGGTTVPNQDCKIGEPFKCSILTNDYVRINKYYTFEDANKWDGKPCYTSWGH